MSDQRRRGLYAAAATTTIVAAAAIFWTGRGVYRHLLFRDGAATTADLFLILTSVVVIQLGYWTVLADRPPFEIRKSRIVSNALLFLSRLSFMLAGALFSIVVFVRFEELDITFIELSLFIAVLFTIFCFSRWLEMLGRVFERGSNAAVD